MKKSFLILILFSIIIVPSQAGASFSNFSSVIKFGNSVYQSSVFILNDLKEVKRGSYFPEVLDSKILSFEDLSVNATEQIKKQKEEERRKKLQEQLKLGNIEASYDGRYIDIDLSSQTLTVFENRAPVYRYKVSTGKRSMPTPTGTTKILNKTSRAYSSKYNLYMPWWMTFRGGGYGIHELPEWPGGAKEGSSHLGTPVSHGCVRLGVGAAKSVYDWTGIGDLVYVHQ